MRILLIGAGALGIPYAALLAEAGNDVTVLARSNAASLQQSGLVVRRKGGPWRTVHAAVVTAIPDEPFDYAIVLVRSNHLPGVFETLQAAPQVANVLVMVQNAGGYGGWLEALGDRLLVGFAGMAANFVDEGVEYEITPRWAQPTTVGEPLGGSSQRCSEVAAMLEDAYLPAWVCPNMDAWQKWHVAWITALANSAQHAGGDLDRIRSAEHRRLTVGAIHEARDLLNARGIAVQPPKLGWVLALPQWVIGLALWGFVRLPLFERDLLANALTSPEEALETGTQMLDLAREHGHPMPAWQTLLQRDASDAA